MVLVPEYRGRGNGLKLAELSFEKMKELNISPVVLTCEESNEPSKKILEHFHIQKKNYTKHFYTEKYAKSDVIHLHNLFMLILGYGQMV